MILKIRDGCTWVFCDEVVRVRVYDPQTYSCEPDGAVHFVEGENKVREASYFTRLYGILGDGKPRSAREVFLKFRDGKESILLIGGEVYLLNDAGQTVEKFIEI